VAVTDVIVVGGGITGLTVAYELSKRGLRPVVLEATARSGGLIRTDHVDGFTIEAGPDAVLVSKPAALELVRELGLDREVQHVRTPGAFVLRGRELFRLPSPSLLGLPLSWRALAGYRQLPWHARVRLALETRVPARTTDDDESVGAFFRRRFGPDTVDVIAQPLLGGIHAGDIEQLSMRSLFPRLLELERAHGSVLASSTTATAGKGIQDTASASGGVPGRAPAMFATLRSGLSALVEALARAVPEGTLRYDTRVDALLRASAGWRVAGIEGRAVVIAAPAHAAAALLRPIDERAAELCAQVQYVSTASVALAWPRAAVPHSLTGTGFVVARRHSPVRITACTWVSSKWEHRAPAGSVLLRAFLGGSHDPDVVSLSDDELVAIARRDLSAVHGITAAPSLARVYRWPHAGAQHTVGHLDRVAEIERRLEGHGIFTAGSGFRSVGIPDCIADARRVAAATQQYLRE
jgi:oxygen-dependent protoporphyrinogen oxidase